MSGSEKDIPTGAGARGPLAFWETGRIGFNAVLLAWTGVLLWQRFEPPPARAEYLVFLGQVFVLVNLAYCVAYPFDLWLGPGLSPRTRLRVRLTALVFGTGLTAWCLERLISTA
jgi:hypothetical protein